MLLTKPASQLTLVPPQPNHVRNVSYRSWCGETAAKMKEWEVRRNRMNP